MAWFKARGHPSVGPARSSGEPARLLHPLLAQEDSLAGVRRNHGSAFRLGNGAKWCLFFPSAGGAASALPKVLPQRFFARRGSPSGGLRAGRPAFLAPRSAPLPSRVSKGNGPTVQLARSERLSRNPRSPLTASCRTRRASPPINHIVDEPVAGSQSSGPSAFEEAKNKTTSQSGTRPPKVGSATITTMESLRPASLSASARRAVRNFPKF